MNEKLKSLRRIFFQQESLLQIVEFGVCNENTFAVN